MQIKPMFVQILFMHMYVIIHKLHWYLVICKWPVHLCCSYNRVCIANICTVEVFLLAVSSHNQYSIIQYPDLAGR